VNRASPVEFKAVELLAIVGKSARIARFIRSSAAVKVSSKLNWFLIVNLVNPLWWWTRRSRRLRRGGAAETTTSKTPAPPRGARVDVQGVPTENTTARDDAGLKRSWRSLVVGATVQSQLEARRRSGVRGAFSKALNVVGIRSEDNMEEIRRATAAIRIQRAWRRAHYHDFFFESQSDEFDVAWKGRGSASNAVDLEGNNRSVLLRNASGRLRRKGEERLVEDATETMKRRNESQVGTAMRELSGQRVAVGIIIALIFTVLLTYTEDDVTRPSTMVVLHNQTGNPSFADKSLDAARRSTIPDMYSYRFANGTERLFELTGDERPDKLRDREKILISINDTNGRTTTAYFSFRHERQEEALVSLFSTLFVLLVWFFGVTSFAGPVMILVVVPIERMVRLLGMLMLDPLGYQSTSGYKRFVAEEDELTKNTHWTKEVLKGMETSFLMSTILRIGSLMKVGFGSAGVEIIRSNLEKGQTKNHLMLSSQGSTVSCIFLFCDIRQFTDATECLQEEVFVFTNRIAAVVHSICHSYGGSANKNIGDAFLLSWLLEEVADAGDGEFGVETEMFAAKDNQADKALLSVVKICVALHHDEYYVETMSEAARSALLAKLSKRKGPIVQMGFGLHAGRAVQGAIGSTRKIDATYVSEAVERAEFLESSTKQYGLKMLMSDSFHRLLHPNNRRRCRKIDQIIVSGEEDDESVEGLPEGDKMDLLTYDLDIDALWKDGKKIMAVSRSETGREGDSDPGSDKGSKREGLRIPSTVRQVSSAMMKSNRRSVKFGKDISSDELTEIPGSLALGGGNAGVADHTEVVDVGGPAELVLPTGPAFYNASVWTNDDMRKMRQRYTDGLFFHNFNAGLQSFYSKDWDHAKQSFITILDRFEDGPSRYFLNKIEKHNGKPPRGFCGYGIE
jgi:class 3 adenylate cyclase